MKNSFFIIAILLGCISCTYYSHNFPYNFNDVSHLSDLDDKMAEISGLTFKNDSILYAVKDEEGEIFEVNLNNSIHSKIIDFKDKGDFEGIAKKGNLFYILKSDGDIYVVEPNGDYEKYTFPSDEKGFEFEGLSLDAESKDLLVACKEHGKKSKNNNVYIYSFSTSKNKYQEKPFLKFDRESIHENFKPSGIAVSPLGNIFLISGISSTIVELSSEGIIMNKAQLPFLIYNQVEGICFDPKGTLFISSEKGKQDRSKIVRINKI